MLLAERYEKFLTELVEAPNDRFLYHYTKLDTALEHILARRELRLSPFTRTNDPREAKAWHISMVGAPGKMELYKKLIAEVDEMLKDTCKVLCLSMDDPDSAARVPISRRGYAHSRMWAQYADRHRGVCLVFQREPMCEEVIAQLDAEGDCYCGKVTYQDHHDPAAFIFDAAEIEQKTLVGAVITHMWRHSGTLFFQKGLDWASEFEFRFVLRKDADRDPFVVSLQESPAGVILGDSVSPAYQPSIDRACEQAGIGACQIVWVNGEPGLRPLQPA